jgi:positive regulator of sigma E activity
MHEVGIVKSIDGVFARVMIGRKSSCCESCEKDTCDIPENGIETEAINTARAAVGQKVKLVMKSHTYVKGIMIIYALPIISLFAGAVLGQMYLPVFIKGIDAELLAALGGFIAFFISLIPIKFLSSKMERKTENRSIIEKVLE